MKKSFLNLVFLLMLCTSCTERGYQFTKKAVHIGMNCAEDVGAFDVRTIRVNTHFEGDTIFYYDGINRYLLRKDGSFIDFIIYPNRVHLEDTIDFYLHKLVKPAPVMDTTRRY